MKTKIERNIDAHKPPKELAWLGVHFVAALFSAYIGMTSLVNTSTRGDLPVNAPSQHYYQFHKNLDRFLKSDISDRNVLVGACQVAWLGDLNNESSFNLGVPDENILEVRRIAEKYFRGDEQIFYLLNFGSDRTDASNLAARPILTHRLNLTKMIASEILLEKAKLGRLIYGVPDPEEKLKRNVSALPKINEAEIPHLSELFNRPKLDRDHARGLQYQLFAASNKRITNLDSLVDLAEKYPRLKYILLPCSTSVINNIPSHYRDLVVSIKEKEMALASGLRKEGVEVDTGLFNLLTLDDFEDLVHPNERGLGNIRKYLSDTYSL